MSFFDFDLLPSTFFYNERYICKPTATSLLYPFYDELVLAPEHKYQHQLGYSLEILSPALLDLTFPCPFPRPAPSPADFGLLSLAERVSALERGLKRLEAVEARDRKYKWTTEIKGGEVDRRYKWVATATATAGGERDLRWTEEIKGKGKGKDGVSRTYMFQTLSSPAGAKKGKKESKGNTTRVVEITDPKTDQGEIFLRKAFARRNINCSKGKRKELSPFEAALIIQTSFRAHIIRRSQVLHGLRDLAIAKAKLKEIRALFSNFTYRRHVAIDAEERQRFTEKIIVLLLTVDAIEGPDHMVRAARKSMIGELEAMLEIVDPQIPGRLGSLRRRKFDLPEGSAFSKEMALGVAEMVELLNQEDSTSNM